MTNLKLSIPDDVMALVNARIAEGRYESPDEYVGELVRRDDRKQRARQVLKDKIQEALDSGPSEPMTREEWDSIEREATERWEREKARK